MARKYQTVTLLVAFDPDVQRSPSEWDWPVIAGDGTLMLNVASADPNTDPVAEYVLAVAERADRWVVGNMGTEEPMRHRDGRRVLYVYNPGRDKHGYLDLDTDVVTEDGEAPDPMEAYINRDGLM